MLDTSIFHGRTAISYQRWSTTKQDDGDSQERQDSGAAAFCLKHKLELVDTIRDKGVSAFKGSNVKAQLGRLLAMYEKGEVSKDTVLIIDDYSRLSRMDGSDALALFLSIINSGIAIGFVRDDMFINREIYNQNPTIPLLALIGISAANQESRQKSWAVKKSYEARERRLAAGEKIKIASVPFWIDRESYEILEDKRPIVERVVNLIRSGTSYLKTAATLNDEGVPSPKGSTWRQSSVQSIIDNPALFGASRFGEGVHEGIFEPLMTKTQWQLLKDQNKTRARAPRSVSGDIPNLFSGIVRCGYCGGKMSVHSFSRRGKPYRYLTCHDSRSLPAHKRCGNKRINLKDFESSFLSRLAADLNADREIVPIIDEREGKIKQLTAAIQTTEQKLNVATDRAVTASSQRLRDRYERTMEELSEQMEDMNKELSSLKLTKPKATELDPDDLEEIFSTLDEDRKGNRQALQARLSRIIDNISVQLGTYQDVIDDTEGYNEPAFKGLADVVLKDGSTFTVRLSK